MDWQKKILVFLALWSIIMSVVHIAMGIVHVHDCTAQPALPVMHSIFGCAVLALLLLNCILDKTDGECDCLVYPFFGLVAIVTVAFFTINGLTYGITPSYHPTGNTTFCNQNMYRFSYVTFILWDIIIGVIGLIACVDVHCISTKDTGSSNSGSNSTSQVTQSINSDRNSSWYTIRESRYESLKHGRVTITKQETHERVIAVSGSDSREREEYLKRVVGPGHGQQSIGAGQGYQSIDY